MNINFAGSVDFNAVKLAFEQCYPAMGIKCAEVGGLRNGAVYYNDKGFDASPCTDPSPPPAPFPSAGMPVGALIGIIVGAALAVIFLLVICYMYKKEKAGTPMFTTIVASK